MKPTWPSEIKWIEIKKNNNDDWIPIFQTMLTDHRQKVVIIESTKLRSLCSVY